MIKREEIEQRGIERALIAGRRWADQSERRTETVRRLKAGGPGAADRPERVERFRKREVEKSLAFLKAGIPPSFLTERRIGPTLDLDDDAPSEAARTAGRPVGRIVRLDAGGDATEGIATGFLLTPELLITNHHVFASRSDCEGYGVQFGYERVSGVLQKGVVFEFSADTFFFSNEALDFAIVAVSPRAIQGTYLNSYGSLTLDPMTGKILVGHPVSIIQYPDGGPKKYGVRDNELLLPPSDEDLFLQYTTDTLPGSSGSPVYNKDWEVVAVHHSGVPEVKDGMIMTINGEPWRRGIPDSDIHWVANEGARISCIYQVLKGATVAPEFQSQHDILMKSFGTDFMSLPSFNTPQELTAMNPYNPAPSNGPAIIVNGPSTFYLHPAPTTVITPAPVVTPPAPINLPAAIEKKIVFDPNYDDRPGYRRDFLGIDVPHPGIAEDRRKEVLKDGRDALILHYHHYSLVMNKDRRTAMWTAVNADYTKKYRRKTRDEFGKDTWVPDPRILGRHQIMDQELYAPAAKFDRGHVVRRDDTAWGVTAKEETFANSDSFHWTNCTPQHEAFNRDAFNYKGVGLWGMLENHIAQQAKNVGNRLSIFAGPILSADDIVHDFGGGTVMIPTRFWKILLVAEDHDKDESRALAAYAFILDQSDAIEDYGIERTERFDPEAFATYQVTVETISRDSGVTFDEAVIAADAMQGLESESHRIVLRSVQDVRV